MTTKKKPKPFTVDELVYAIYVAAVEEADGLVAADRYGAFEVVAAIDHAIHSFTGQWMSDRYHALRREDS